MPPARFFHFRRILPGLLAILAMIAGVPQAGATTPAAGQAVLQRWIDGQQNLRSLAISFQQERLLKGLRKPIVTNGKIWLDRRGLMRWQMGDPPKTIAIYKDKEVLVLHPGKQLVEKRTLGTDATNQSEMEKAFLESGIPRSLDDFQKFFRVLGTTRENNLEKVQLEVKDSKAQAALTSMEFLIDPASNLLAGYDVGFRDGSRIRTRFLQVTRNTTIDDALFSPDTTGYRVEALKP